MGLTSLGEAKLRISQTKTVSCDDRRKLDLRRNRGLARKCHVIRVARENATQACCQRAQFVVQIEAHEVRQQRTSRQSKCQAIVYRAEPSQPLCTGRGEPQITNHTADPTTTTR